jgi:PRC-barrel domain
MLGSFLGSFRTTLAIMLLALCSAGSSSADNVGLRTSDASAEPSVTILEPRQVQSVLGREVRSSANENMGRIVDVIVDRTGSVRAAIIDFGGFLGVGSRKIAVDWSALHFSPDSNKRDVITLELTRDQVKESPEYKDKKSVVVLGAAGGLQPLPMD